MARTPRTTRTRRAGVVVATTGLVLAASGLGTGVAGATPKGGDLQITICHATSSVTNPYTVITVSVSAADGGLGKGGNDHSSHTGPVFDFTADPSDPDYPYHPPAKDWGDIIPPFQWDGGSFPGLNWGETGQAVHAAGCAAPAQDPGDEQPGEDPETEDPETEDPETEDPGDQPEDEEPAVDACPDVEGVQVDAAECEVGLVPPFVVENDDAEVAADGEVAGPRGPARRPTEVAGIQVLPQGRTGTAQQLPRTGADTTALALAGLGLVLMGAGAVVAARRPSGAPVR